MDDEGTAIVLRLPHELVVGVAACVRHLVASFDSFVKAHRRAHSLPGTRVPCAPGKMSPFVFFLDLFLTCS